MEMPCKPRCSKLTWEKVRQIRELRASGAPLSELEARFGVLIDGGCAVSRAGLKGVTIGHR